MKWILGTTLACSFSFSLLFLASCVMGGAYETVTIVMVEAGAVCEVATDKPIDVIVPAEQPGDKPSVGRKNLAGCIAMPKSVYRQMRECWIAAHPAEKAQ